MAPNAYAPASLGFAIVFLTIAILPCFALLGFGIYKLRSWMASRRPVDVEAAIIQIQTEVVPVVARLGCDSRQMAPNDNLQGSRDPSTINSSTGAEPIQADRPDSSLLVEEPSKESTLDVEAKISSAPGPAPSSSFEIWANRLFTMKDEFADEGCSLSSSYSLASTVDTDCSSTDSTDTIEKEHEPEVNVYELETEDIDDVLSIDTESTCIGLVSSPSFMDLSAVCDEDDAAPPTIIITSPTSQIEWKEDGDYEPFESLLVASPSFTALATAFDEEFNEETINEEDDGLDEAMQAMAALTTHELEPIAEEQEPEDEEIAEPTRYNSLALLPSSRSATKQGTPQRNRDKENQNERSPTKHRNSLKSLPMSSSVSSTPIAVPTIKFTPPTPPRRFIDGDDVSLESEYESDERVALDIVVDDDGSFFF
ncbi:hypothetical protein VNI00_014233 [Paramarasmius palmivorus]|uniref:Uncharacterized protein n=1 Tax=Paramarasmius palmivorus TaxID=297713 RepID=A0AAW0BYL9_9AGAR